MIKCLLYFNIVVRKLSIQQDNAGLRVDDLISISFKGSGTEIFYM